MRKPSSVLIALVISLGVGIKTTGQESAGNPSPTPEHKKLAAFVGNWKEGMDVKARAGAEAQQVSFTEKCEWFSGGFTVICHNQMDGSDLKGLQIMTYDSGEKAYKDYEFDSTGHNSFATGTLEDDTWTWRSENRIRGKLVKTRVRMKVVSPEVIVTKTEMLDESGTWKAAAESKRTREK